MASKAALRIPTSYIGIANLREFVNRAAEGETIDYAWGPALDPAEPVAQAVREAIGGGTFDCVQRRGSDRGLVHVLRRKAVLIKRALTARISRDEEWEATPDGRLFLLLVRLANLDKPCPTYRELGETLGLRDLQAARYLLGKLIEAKRVTVAMVSDKRIVTIVETGKRTAAR